MRNTVLDHRLLLALFFDEPSAEKVEQVLCQSAEADKTLLMTAVNWAEVLYSMQKLRGEQGLATARRFLATIPVQIVPADCDLAELASEYKATNGLNLADAFTTALTTQRKAELITNSDAFKVVQDRLKRIVWLR